jgi:radical SAM superfamily enzyme YgiQ (UPF0313 family)
VTDVLLVNPKTSLNIENNEPLNLMSLASYLRVQGLEPAIHDEMRPREPLEERVRRLEYVGITANTCSYPRAVAINRMVKGANPEATTIVGGVHATTMPEQALADGFDVVVKGEGEKALVSILRDGVKGGIVTGGCIEDEEMYRPARDLVDMPFYLNTKARCPHDPNLDFVKWGMKSACYLTSRGCPFSCIFCHNIWRKTSMRYAPVDLVMEELTDLKERHGAGAVWLMDDHIFLNKHRCRQLFTRMIGSNLNLLWASAARVDSLDEDLLELAYEAGCRRLALGIESGSDRVLQRLDKGSSVAQNFAAVEACRRRGIRTLATVMVGNPEETLEDVRATMRFLIKSKTDYAAVSVLTPFPGTELWKQCEREGRLNEQYDFSTFDYLRAPIPVTDHLTPPQLEKLKRNVLVRFYLQPRQLAALAGKFARNPASMFSKIVEYF